MYRIEPYFEKKEGDFSQLPCVLPYFKKIEGDFSQLCILPYLKIRGGGRNVIFWHITKKYRWKKDDYKKQTPPECLFTFCSKSLHSFITRFCPQITITGDWIYGDSLEIGFMEILWRLDYPTLKWE